MFAKRLGGSPEQWDTKDVLKWIQENDDSKNEIRKGVLSVVRANDLDGHTLRQLACEKDEIQELFPSLKERLAFKSLLRKMFKDDSTTTLQSTSEQTNIPTKLMMSSGASQPIRNPKSFLAAPTMPGRSQVAFIHGPQPTRPLPPIHTSMTVPLQLTQPGCLPEAQRQTEKRSRPPYLEIKTDTPSGFDTLQRQNKAPSAPKLQQQGNPGIRNTTVSVSSPMQQNNTPVGPNRQTANSNTALTYFTQSEISPQAKRRAVEIVCHSVGSPTRSIPSTASYPPPVTSEVGSLILTSQGPAKETISSPQITSVTSLAPVGSATTIDQTQPGLGPRHTCSIRSTKDLQDPNTQPSPIIPTSRRLVNRIPIGYPAPLPVFSEEVQRLLAASITTTKGSIISVAARRKVVKECAEFYMTITMGNKLNSSDYANIGRTIIENHPELECDSGVGMPWASFNKNLSQSIRNLRRRLKAKKVVSLLKTDGAVGGLKLLEDDSFDSIGISDDEEEEEEEIVEEIEDGGEDDPVIYIKKENPT